MVYAGQILYSRDIELFGKFAAFLTADTFNYVHGTIEKGLLIMNFCQVIKC